MTTRSTAINSRRRGTPNLMDHVNALASGFAWALDVSHRIDRETSRHSRIDHRQLHDIVFNESLNRR